MSFTALIYAIDELQTIKPKNLKTYYKYVYPKYWEELEAESLKVGNKFNSSNKRIEWPKGFKENITENINKGIISKDQVEDIFEFFEG